MVDYAPVALTTGAVRMKIMSPKLAVLVGRILVFDVLSRLSSFSEHKLACFAISSFFCSMKKREREGPRRTV
jgi:hypothetical protein